jgi:hypothetical protein
MTGLVQNYTKEDGVNVCVLPIVEVIAGTISRLQTNKSAESVN